MSLTELRALAHPSADVEALLGAIITVVKGPSADHSWTKGAKRLMANLDRYKCNGLKMREKVQFSTVIAVVCRP